MCIPTWNASGRRRAVDVLEEYRHLQPEVVLTDVMPEMDGATAAIRRQFPQIRVIALTSYREDELVE